MLINFAGIDGCGKSTQVELLKRHLTRKGIDVQLTKAFDQQMKELLGDHIETASQLEILFLFQALHVRHLNKTQRLLREGFTVITDRWDEAYETYHSQYGVLSEDPALRVRLNEIAYGEVKPDVTIFLEIDPRISKARTQERGDESVFDKKKLSYHQKLAEAYDRLATFESGWVRIDATQSVEAIHAQIVESLSQY